MILTAQSEEKDRSQQNKSLTRTDQLDRDQTTTTTTTTLNLTKNEEQYAQILYRIAKNQESRFMNQVQELRSIIKIHEQERQRKMKKIIKRDDFRKVTLGRPRKKRKRGRTQVFKETYTLESIGPMPAKHTHVVGVSCQLCKWLRKAKRLKSSQVSASPIVSTDSTDIPSSSTLSPVPHPI